MLKTLLLGLPVPALVCAAFLLLGWRARRSGAPDPDGGPVGGWGGGVGLMHGYFIAHAAIAGWAALRPVDVTDWLPHAAIAAVLVELVALYWPRAVVLHWLLRLAASAAAVVVVSLPTIRYTWTTTQSVIAVPVLVLALYASWASLGALATRTSASSLGVTIMIAAGVGSVTLVASRTAKLSQLCAAIAAMAGAALVLAWWKRRLSLGAAGAGVAALLLGYLWMQGYLYAEMPMASALLLAAAPSAAWVGRLAVVRKLPPWLGVCVQAAAVLVPAGAALGVALAAAAGTDTGYPGY
jgi:hypothetical protein